MLDVFRLECGGVRWLESVRALQEMFEAHQPSVWCLGHFHINREFLIGDTKFRCLAEMAGFEVVSCDSSGVWLLPGLARKRTRQR